MKQEAADTGTKSKKKEKQAMEQEASGYTIQSKKGEQQAKEQGAPGTGIRGRWRITNGNSKTPSEQQVSPRPPDSCDNSPGTQVRSKFS